MPTFDTYGLETDSPEDVRTAIETTLGIELQTHDSSYHGGEYFRYGEMDEEHFILQRNWDFQEDEPAEPEFEAYGVLMYVNHTKRSPNIRQLLEQSIDGITLLKHEVQ